MLYTYIGQNSTSALKEACSNWVQLSDYFKLLAMQLSRYTGAKYMGLTNLSLARAPDTLCVALHMSEYKGENSYSYACIVRPAQT